MDRKLLQIPRRFIIDHEARELPTPVYAETSTRNIWIWSDDPALPELIDDAEYYCDPYGPGSGDRDYIGVRNSARSMLKALKRQDAYAGNFKHGEQSKAKQPAHVCGLQGFGRGADGASDRCPACEQGKQR